LVWLVEVVLVASERDCPVWGTLLGDSVLYLVRGLTAG